MYVEGVGTSVQLVDSCVNYQDLIITLINSSPSSLHNLIMCSIIIIDHYYIILLLIEEVMNVNENEIL